jgi:SAM-dependent methyltransferase
MGIEAFSLRMLCEARLQNASFTATATLGRQHLSVRAREIKAILRETGLTAPPLPPQNTSGPVFADLLLRELLGIEQLVSIDCSPYEGASVAHDMNLPIPEAHFNRYDAVIDGGTLEHVFNVPAALANCMKMLKPGGRFYALTPANNHCGHGFYQFSPEFFFRVFSAANGFEVEHLFAIEHPYPGIELSSRRKVYAVSDPATLGERVGLVTRHPVYLFVQAVKRAQVEPFVHHPQQSDYARAWSQAGKASGARSAGGLGRWAERYLPYLLRRHIEGATQRWRQNTFSNRRHYRRWNQAGRPPRA